MVYELKHTTSYDYSAAISLAHHVVRLRPRKLACQECLNHSLEINPEPSLVAEHLDFYGNVVQFVSLESPHENLTITSRSKVIRSIPEFPEPDSTPGWETVRDLFKGNSGLDSADFISDSPLIKTSKALAAFASPSFTRHRPIFSAVLDFTSRLRSEFVFDNKATTVTTPVEEFFKKKRGVCQDFAHLQIACLRSIGLSARYISGYLETEPPPGKPKLTGADASHAWVSFFIPDFGWIDIDPTNNTLPKERHLTVAAGRDYSDVAPIRGVIIGSGEHSLKVSVDVTPVSPAEAHLPEHAARTG